MDLPSTILLHASNEEKEGWVKELKVPYKGRFELVRSLGLALGDDPQSEPLLVEARTSRTRPLPKVLEEDKTGPKRPKLMLGSDMLPPTGPSAAVTEKSVPSVVRKSATEHLKAAKDDDADVPYHLWNNRISNGLSHLNGMVRDRLAGRSDPGWLKLRNSFSSKAKERLRDQTVESVLARLLSGLRRLALRKWKTLVRRSFWAWWKTDCGNGAKQG